MNQKTILRSVLAAVLSLVANTASAHDFEVNGIYYNKEGTTVTVTSGDNKYSGDIVIPSSVTYQEITYSVTQIDYHAFEECSGLTNVSIPNSVFRINDYAFYGCSGLTSVNIPNSVKLIMRYAFKNCSGLKSVTIGNSVTHIGSMAFNGCINLESIIVNSGNTTYDSRDNCNAIIKTESNSLIFGCKNTIIPNTVTSIGGYAFDGCSGLTSVTIPNSVTSIGESAFSYCSSLTSVTIPNSVTSIGYFAFGDCSGLTTVSIGNSVTSIGPSAFSYCIGLTSITIPNSVTSIDESVFYGCSGLESIVVESGNTTYDSRDNCNAIIETATNTLLVGFKNTIIPNSVTSIGESAFSGCSGLTKAIVKAITPPSIDSQTFDNFDLKLIVPAISKEEYKSANIWSLFTNYADAEIMIITLGLEKNNASIKSGETLQLTATAKPVDATFADVFLWTSSDEDVATVDGNGVVTAIADGTATITAQTVDGSNLTATCVVTVGAGAVEGVDSAAARIYSANGNIIIAAAEDGEAAVYDFTGRLIKSVPVIAGDNTAVPVMPGCYIVKTGTTTQSLIVK